LALLHVAVFTNDVTPGADNVVADFTLLQRSPLLPPPGARLFSPLPWGPAFSGANGLGQKQSAVMAIFNDLTVPVKTWGWIAIDELGFYAFGDRWAAPPILIGSVPALTLLRIALFEDTLRGF
jgi:hypothetical protein